MHCVASKNIETLSILYPHLREIVPPSIFLCNIIRSLTLFDKIVSKIATRFGGFNHLTHCFFHNVEFKDDTLSLFVSHCSLLKELELVSPLNIIIIWTIHEKSPERRRQVQGS